MCLVYMLLIPHRFSSTSPTDGARSWRSQERKPISVDFVITKQRNSNSNNNNINNNSNNIKTARRWTKKNDTAKDDVFVFDTKRPTDRAHNVNYNDIIPFNIILWCIQPYFVYLIYFTSPFSVVFIRLSLFRMCHSDASSSSSSNNASHHPHQNQHDERQNDEFTHTLNCSSFH